MLRVKKRYITKKLASPHLLSKLLLLPLHSIFRKSDAFDRVTVVIKAVRHLKDVMMQTHLIIYFKLCI